jgi:hypothetical protein
MKTQRRTKGKANKPRPVSAYLERPLIRTLQREADAQGRSLSGHIEFLIKECRKRGIR